MPFATEGMMTAPSRIIAETAATSLLFGHVGYMRSWSTLVGRSIQSALRNCCQRLKPRLPENSGPLQSAARTERLSISADRLPTAISAPAPWDKKITPPAVRPRLSPAAISCIAPGAAYGADAAARAA
jgi:hypothetical protein